MQNSKLNIINIIYINNILKKRKAQLEKKILAFDDEAQRIQKEMQAEKIRLEKLEKEKYFRNVYFDTRTKETEDSSENNPDFNNQTP